MKNQDIRVGYLIDIDICVHERLSLNYVRNSQFYYYLFNTFHLNRHYYDVLIESLHKRRSSLFELENLY